MDLWAALNAADDSEVYSFEHVGSNASNVTNKLVGVVVKDVSLEKTFFGNNCIPVNTEGQGPLKVGENDVLEEPVVAGGTVCQIDKVLVKPASMKNRQIENTSVKRLSVNGYCNNRRVRNGRKKAVGEESCQNSVKSILKKRVVKKNNESKAWSYITQFTIDAQHWAKLHKNLELDDKYVEYFTNLLLSEVKIACVLKSAGPFVGYGKFNMRFNCTNGPCKKKFLVKQIIDSNFKLYDNGEPEYHDGNERARPVKNVKRTIVTKALTKMNPEDYLMFCQNGVSKELYERGHLQDLISIDTATKMRKDGLIEELDYDKDDIIDLLKMKLSDEYKLNVSKEGSDIFVRRINLDPFAVLMYSNAQLKILKTLALEDDDFKLFFDATGSVVRHAKKRVFYYSGVCCVKKNRNDSKEKSRLQPVLEILSGEHDGQNIRLLLEDFKHDFEVKYPHAKWPIRYTITDFSFALMNAICRAWNGVTLLRYINLTYKFANHKDFKNKLSEYGIDTFLQLCCGHFSKTQCNDVAKYFPNLDSKTQSILKEIIIAMFDIGELDQLRIIWTNLSTLFLCKYVDENVENALKNLTELILNKSQNKEKVNEGDEDCSDDKEDDDEDDEIPCDTEKFEPIYKQSEYYKDFSNATFKPQFQTGTLLNTFYNVEFASVFLKKYISILCFWTCITQTHRISNAPDECHFKNTKGRMKRKAVQIGPLPLKAGRFCRELQIYTNGVTLANLMKYPRKNNCYKQTAKRKASDGTDEPEAKKSKLVDGIASILSLYKAAPKPRTPQAPKTPKNRKTSNTPTTRANTLATETDTSATVTTGVKNRIVQKRLEYDDTVEEDDVPIDDLRVEEQWYKRRPARYSHMDKKVLQDIHSKTDEERKKCLVKNPKGSQGKGVTTGKLNNGLIDNPDMYLKPTINYAVSRLGNIVLKRDDYTSLSGSDKMKEELISYIWRMFQNGIKGIQFEQVAISKIFNKCDSTMLKIKLPSLIGLHGSTLVIINCKTKTFGYVDPTTVINADEELYLKNFIDFLVRHNVKYPKNKVTVDGWKVQHYDHEVCGSADNPMLFTLRYVQKYIEQKKVDGEIKSDLFRKELLHLILWKSMTMKNRCVQCGLAELPEKYGETSTTWVECNNCKRWVHIECLHVDLEKVEDETLNYFCVVCQANTPTSVTSDGLEPSTPSTTTTKT